METNKILDNGGYDCSGYGLYHNLSNEYTWLDSSYPFDRDGYIDKWCIHTRAEGKVKLKIFRGNYTIGATKIYDSGFKDVVVGKNEFSILSENIFVNKGDYIAFYADSKYIIVSVQNIGKSIELDNGDVDTFQGRGGYREDSLAGKVTLCELFDMTLSVVGNGDVIVYRNDEEIGKTSTESTYGFCHGDIYKLEAVPNRVYKFKNYTNPYVLECDLSIMEGDVQISNDKLFIKNPKDGRYHLATNITATFELCDIPVPECDFIAYNMVRQ